MFKSYLLKKMMERQLQNMPTDQKEKIMNIVTKNPDLFMKIAQEAQAKIKEGKTQEAAMMEVMKAHQDELRKAMG